MATDLYKLKQTFDSIGIYYKESVEDEYTYISMCNEKLKDFQ